jgi:hypothetical protein
VLGVEAWTTIRYLNAQGVGIRAMCRQLGVSRTAVLDALRSAGPPRYQRPARPNPQLVANEAQIHRWFFEQHLIGSRILRELRAAKQIGCSTESNRLSLTASPIPLCGARRGHPGAQ